ncbi:E3 ubiquitin-protein ligase TRIM21-like [Sphaeramia orbicularis]|uniref:E3 ubiquitin-protein ligase TRIM21-like n=1 Tax=Sphaeramia orbicularis TaxID=375764 RepID=A0A672YVS7_9TELE|nr:E3 ubiquitin-protein ligase TRIM21-like [Sphaeramia orbicularis]
MCRQSESSLCLLSLLFTKTPETHLSNTAMSSARGVHSEDQFLCSICLDVFTDPVTTPCGHNFCKNCITQHWDVNVQNQCPLCNEAFNTRPNLRINTFISEMVAEFRQSRETKTKQSRCSGQQTSKAGEVLCDICTETKLKALKSCLMCLSSYCETHLEVHQKITLTRHQLIDPVENLEDRMCKRHDRPLELFCKTDQVCVCQFCTESHHKSHVFTPLEEEYEEKKAELEKTEAELQQMIQDRQVKAEKIKQLVRLSKDDAEKEIETSVQLFTALIQSAERSLTQLIDTIEEKQKEMETKAEGFITEMEEEISELVKTRAKVDQLIQTEDPLQLLQSLPHLNTVPHMKDWKEVHVHLSYEGTVRTAVAQLEETFSTEMKKLAEAELKRVQQFAVDVTLDPDTASPYLILSDDGKQVKSSVIKMNVPDNPLRFTYCNGVLGKPSILSRVYFEVDVKGKTEWDLGVATESVNRGGKIRLSPKNGFWTIWLRNGNQYRALAGPSVLLSLKSQLHKVGMFVDYDRGVVSFYDADTTDLIYSFTGCNFTEKLYPYFSPCNIDGGKNSAPLTIIT